jgi:hypothetical protein
MGEAQDMGITGALPRSMTAFVGRERELDELRSLFREGKRLVTLVGAGGIGKSRLALELGADTTDLFRSRPSASLSFSVLSPLQQLGGPWRNRKSTS